MMKRNTILCLFLGTALLAGCAKEKTTNGNEDNKTYLEAWLRARHPGVTASGIGIYILDDQPGNGTAYTGQDHIYAEYTSRDLDGNITGSTSRRIAQQLGTYNPSYYYGPAVIASNTDNLQAGLEALLTGMRTGGTRTALIPNWLLTYNRYSSADEYLRKANAGNNAHTIYTVSLQQIIEDEAKWELDSLSRFIARNAPDAVPVKDEEGFYYRQITAPTDTTSFPKDTTIYINYTGRLLNGQVFDTTIKDTAKVHNIYSSSKTYAPVSISWAEEATDLKMGTSGSSVIEGFSKTLFQMRTFEKGVGYFVSAKGYGSSGSGSTIPSYSPLIFEIEIVEATTESL